MGLKENISAIKQEIGAEEQFLESMIKGERFIKKYKKIILAILIALAIFGVVYAVVNFVHERRLQAGNEAYLTLMSDAKDVKALESLASNNPQLHNLFMLTTALQNEDKIALQKLSQFKDDVIIADFAAYQLASFEGKTIQTSELFEGLVQLQKGYALMLKGKVAEARLEFALINDNSPLKNIARSLEHYQGK
ncbi:MAG: hypothetical protein IBX44_06000 [Sulfurospirillum sp.]|nr:hypothetical protein [Sulfurospirillum sp.]